MRIWPRSTSAKRSSSRVNVVLPPPDRPTSPTFVPGSMAQREALEEQRLRRRVAEGHIPQFDARESAAANGSRLGWSTTAGGSSSNSVNCAASVSARLEVAVDAVELPHHAGRRRVVAERDEHRLEARAGAAACSDSDHESERIGQHVHRRRDRVDAQVLVIPRA